MAEWFPKQRIGDLPADAARRWGEREALYYNGRRWSYHAFDAEVDRVARGLIGIGVEPSERVALWLTNRPEMMFLFYAILKVGAVAVPLNTRYRTLDLKYALAQANCGTLITADRSGPIDYLTMVGKIIPKFGIAGLDLFPDLKRVVFVGEKRLSNTISWDEVLAAGVTVDFTLLEARAAAVDPDGLAMIVYTSGSSGNPKGVMHSHICIRSCTDRAAIWGVTVNDTHINYLPMFHLFAISEVMLSAILTGARQILMDKFDGDEAIRLIEQERVTIMHGYDTHWRDIMEAQATAPRDLGSLRFGTFPSGLDSTVPLATRAQKELCMTVSGCGMTEVWSYISASSLGSTAEQRCEASGYPMPGIELRIIDPATGLAVPTGCVGEIQWRGYTVTLGYYNQPEATKALFAGDGWVHSGDMGLIRPDGHLRLVGRYKDMLKVGGENVSSLELEISLTQIPGIEDAAVVGYPDPRLHEVAVAFVVRKGGSRILDEFAVIEHFKGKIASFKIPRHVFFVSELPRTSLGKIEKGKLKARAIEELGAPM